MSTLVLKNIALISAILYYIAFALNFFEGYKKQTLLQKIVWTAGIIANAMLVANNWIVNGYVPFVSIYQVLTFLAVCFAPIYLFLSCMYKEQWMSRYFCLASGIVMTGVFFMDPTNVWHFPPALQSVWFVPHILAYMISYSLCTVAFIITLISFIKKDNKPLFDKGIYTLVCTSFPFMTAGLLFGAIWANEVWGDFWSFDIKENWALITWLFYMLYLHAGRHKKLIKYSKVFVILGFVALIFTMLFVNIFGGSSQHAYSTN